MVGVVYLRKLLKVALIIILESPLGLCFLCITSSLMSALPLCQQYSLFAEQTANISSVFLGQTLPGTDLPQLLQPTANTEGISNSLTFGNLSISQTEPAGLGFGFPFFAHALQELQTHKAFKHPLSSTPGSQHCTNQGWDRGRHRESWCGGRMHCFPDASFPGSSGATQWWLWATWEGHRASRELQVCNATWGEKKNPVTYSSFENGPQWSGTGGHGFKSNQRSRKNSLVHLREFLLSEEKSHEFYSFFFEM